ncbi:hypothetical protein N9L20_09400 [Flavobacteriaceae bacterium]|nr:hypothetical protein [Flavobacteriaceae bacterium]
MRVLILGVIIAFSSCNKYRNRAPSTISPGNDPNFTIVANSDIGFEGFNRKVEVFNIPIYALQVVDDIKLLHAANVLAQYLDNDEDGAIDDSLVLDKMLENNAFIVMWNNAPDELFEVIENEDDFLNLGLGQDLGGSETHPSFVQNGKIGEFDAALEEVLHIINNAGHSYAYPKVFGQNTATELANAMDIARGGQFLTVPNQYPATAWYSYDDETCEYADCQTMEYLYWALTSMLGAQENRLSDIDDEWILNTRQKVENTDRAIFALLTNSAYKMPRILPDGTYRH